MAVETQNGRTLIVLGDGDSALSAAQVGVRSAAWFAVVPIVLLHIYLRNDAYDLGAGVCAGLLGSLALLSIAYTRPRTLPALAVVLAKLYLAAGLAPFREPRLKGYRATPIYLSHDGLSKAMLGVLLLAVMATACMTLGKPLGDFARRRLKWPNPSGLAHSTADRLVARSVGLTCVTLHAALTAYGESSFEFGTAAHVATLLLSAPFPLTLLWFDMTKDPTAWSRWLVNGSAMVYVIVGLGTGMLGAVMEPIMVIMVLKWAETGRLPWVTIGGALVLALLLNGVKGKYREMAWHSATSLGVLDRAEMWVSAIQHVYGEGGTETETAAVDSADSVASRLQIVPQIAQVMDWVPSIVPHAGPELWLTLPLEFVPRFLWNDKPVHLMEYNVRYTLTFGIQHERTRTGTAVALPPVADGYWRIGWWGVAIEGMLLGLLIGFYGALFDTNSPATVALGASFIATASAETHIFGTLAGQPQSLLAMAAAFVLTAQLALLLRGRSQASKPSPAAHSPEGIP